jgi:hypothetical protein
MGLGLDSMREIHESPSPTDGDSLGLHKTHAPYLLDICPTASRANETGRHQVDKHAKKAVGPMFQKADPDHRLSHGTTYVRINGGYLT